MWTQEPRVPKPWPQPAIELLRKLHAGNQSGGTISLALIAAGFNYSRSAVISMARKLKLKNDRGVGRTGMPGDVPKPRRRIGRIVVTPPRSEPKPIEPEPHPHRTGRLLDLDSRQCRFPFGPVHQRPPYNFCCEDAVDGTSFCALHAARVFVAPHGGVNLHGMR